MLSLSAYYTSIFYFLFFIFFTILCLLFILQKLNIPNLILFCFILSYLILSYLVLSCLILSNLILSYLIMSYLILSDIMLSYHIISYLILSCLILHSFRFFGYNTSLFSIVSIRLDTKTNINNYQLFILRIISRYCCTVWYSYFRTVL